MDPVRPPHPLTFPRGLLMDELPPVAGRCDLSSAERGGPGVKWMPLQGEIDPRMRICEMM